MKKILFLILLVISSPKAAWSSPLNEPSLNQCNHASGITKCDVICKRSLSDQCLITHINFEGTKLKSNTPLLRARFQTCKNANLDFQISSLTVELEKLDTRKTEAKISSTINASNKNITLDEHLPIQFDATTVEGRLSRTYFNEFINSGESFVEAEIHLKQCGHEDKTNSCKIYGQLIAITDPNISCDFHETTKPGAYREPDKVFLPTIHNKVKAVGRIVQ